MSFQGLTSFGLKIEKEKQHVPKSKIIVKRVVKTFLVKKTWRIFFLSKAAEKWQSTCFQLYFEHRLPYVCAAFLGLEKTKWLYTVLFSSKFGFKFLKDL